MKQPDSIIRSGLTLEAGPDGAVREADVRRMEDLTPDFVRLRVPLPDTGPIRLPGNWSGTILKALDTPAFAGLPLELVLALIPGCGSDFPVIMGGMEAGTPWPFGSMDALKAYAQVWAELAELLRHRGPDLSFVLFEAPGCPGGARDATHAEYAVAVRVTAAAIRAVDPLRPLVLEGLDRGRMPPTDLFDVAPGPVATAFRLERSADGSPDNLDLDMLLRTWQAFSLASGMELRCAALGGAPGAPVTDARSWISRVRGALGGIGLGPTWRQLDGPYGASRG